MAQTILNEIRAWLAREAVPYREVQHSPTLTSEDSARARGEELRVGGKALLMRADADFALFVLPADRKLDSRKIRRELLLRKLRFASREELASLTGLVPGAVPPFGRPILPLSLYIDVAVCENDRIAFNAGSLTDSIVLSRNDYLRLASPERIFSFSAPP